MADINSPDQGTVSAPPQRREPEPATRTAVADDRLVKMVELLFFAYREFTAEPDAILAELGFGRAHHRVLHFVSRNPGLRVADLLGILRITKQSLARVLRQLVAEGFVEQTTGPEDRRERRLEVTSKGAALAERLLHIQTQRIGAALSGKDGAVHNAAESFLQAMIAPEMPAAMAGCNRPERKKRGAHSGEAA